MKKLLSLLVAAAILIPSTAAFAAGTEANPDKTARQTFKQQLLPKKTEIKTLHDQNTQLRESIKSKREEIKSIIKGLKSEKSDASKAKLQEVKKTIENLALKESRENLKALKDAGKPYWESLKTNVKAMNLDGALSDLGNIANVRTQRHDLLQKIDTALSQILETLK